MKNLDTSTAYRRLVSLKKELKPLQALSIETRGADYTVKHPLLTFSFANTHLTADMFPLLQDLVVEQDVAQSYKNLLGGQRSGRNLNFSVQHHHLRGNGDLAIKNRTDISGFADYVHRSGRYSAVVYVGIGGSYLGPEVLYQALRHVCTLKMDVFFLHSLDPCNLKEIMAQVSFKETLFIFSSKSGGTYETLENLRQLRVEAEKHGISERDFTEQCVGITCKDTYLDRDEFCKIRFYIVPEIVGRFSTTSAIGMVMVSLAFGWDIVLQILEGAASLDESAKEGDFRKNPSLASALLTIWERNILGFPAKAIIPYSYGLSRFPAFLQQLICESNGKRVNKDGETLSYSTSPAIFGEPGTEAQHSFFQMLHQGTDITPVQFISLGKVASRDLYINMKAQIAAMAMGNTDLNPFEFCPGNRPSTIVEISGLSPKTLGALVAFYENVVMFEGFLWNINSFDQEGVQLGKKLAEQLSV